MLVADVWLFNWRSNQFASSYLHSFQNSCNYWNEQGLQQHWNWWCIRWRPWCLTSLVSDYSASLYFPATLFLSCSAVGLEFSLMLFLAWICPQSVAGWRQANLLSATSSCWCSCLGRNRFSQRFHRYPAVTESFSSSQTSTLILTVSALVMLMLNLAGALAAILVLSSSRLVSATCSFSMFWSHRPAFSTFWSFWSWTHDVLSSCLSSASSQLGCQLFLPVTSSAARHFHFQAQLQVSLDSFDSFSSVFIQHPLPSNFDWSPTFLKQTDLDLKSWFAHWDSAICWICLLSTML